MMTNYEKYKQAFAPIRSEKIADWKEPVKKRGYAPRKAFASALCALLLVSMAITAYAYGDEILRTIYGWGSNLKVEETPDGMVAWLDTEHLVEPVVLEDGRMYFIADGSRTDITDTLTRGDYYTGGYTDEDGIVHVLLVGLNTDELENYGYAEYLQDENGTWLSGYSARVNLLADDTPEALWLQKAKSDLQIPW